MRVSNYNIYVPIVDREQEFILVQGITGAFDVVDRRTYELLREAKSNETILDMLSDDVKAALIKRGYITDKNHLQEKEILKRISSTIQSKTKNSIHVTFVPTYNCNFRCEYCFEQKLIEKGKDWLNAKLDNSIIDATFKQLEEYKRLNKRVDKISLFGGEPLLRSNYEIVKYIIGKSNELGAQVFAVTNGYSLDAYEDLLGPSKIEAIQVTLDGLASTHNSRRYLVGKQPTYDTICDNITLALDKGVKVSLRTNVNKKNFDSIEKLLELYKEKGWLGRPNFNYYFKATHRCYEKETDVTADIEIMNQLANSFGDVEKFQFNTMYSHLSESFKQMLLGKGYAPMRSGYCGAVSGMYTVDPYGDIYSCWDVLGDQKEVIGKVNTEENRFDLGERCDYWQNRTCGAIEKCSNCEFALFCGGGCGAHANVVNGNHYTPYCEDFKTIFYEVVPSLYKKYCLQEVNA
ncbi:radical SAM/SPASM domain-containing protein [Clostridium fungisolvens]|uniref:Antilisterial bacteriocin subtilosin biosynthesis protein AlbA n=1 Tax=Clostridium fungisolvens TaxID=1604897 RepID=A0A6V8SKJ0_9CLOT|nr:radical SAM protein [Clostridium fungisolvens]GFP77749.1 Antilisterial bacteriocin subtilosin biosynthesis protein AlbA [Clostridium fungisolvens]